MTTTQEERLQEEMLFRRHGPLRPKPAYFAKLHSSRKFFDSGEYFMKKEGRSPEDLLPGGAPVEDCIPKLAPTPKQYRTQTLLDQVMFEQQQQSWAPTRSVSDY